MTWLTGWSKRIKLTSDNTKVAASVKGLAIDLSHLPADFWSNVKSDGADIRITTSDGETLVARDVVSIDTTAETGLVRFDSSSISTSANTDFYLYYQNSSATEPGNTGAYDSNLVAYFPMNETSGNAVNRITQVASTTSNMTYGSVGKFGSAFTFNGTNSQINTGTTISLTNKSFTIRGWFANTKSTSLGSYIVRQRTSDTTRQSLHVGGRGNGKWTLAFYSDDVDSVTNMTSDGTWQQWTSIFNTSGNVQTINLNGVQNATRVSGGALGASGGTFFIGGQFPGDFYGGRADEFMVFYKALSANEDLTMYNNENNNDTFWTFGTPETDGFTITTLPASNITFNSAQLNGEVTNYDE